jgi:phage tail tape-measure protein
MLDRIRKGWKAVNLVKDTIDLGLKAGLVLSAPVGERKRLLVEEAGALVGGLVGGSLGAAGGGKLGALASPAGSLVGAGLGGLAGGKVGEELGRTAAASLYERYIDSPSSPEPVTYIGQPYRASYAAAA